MSPPHNGNQHLPFIDLIKLRKIDETTYQSIALPFAPGGRQRKGRDRSYGGHVYAQAAWAASQTVGKGLVIYNAVGTFLLGGQVRVPFTYRVQKLRDGRSFATRLVYVTQGSSEDITFTALISFKKDETNVLELQEDVDLWQRYASALKGRRPEEFRPTAGMDAPWYLALSPEERGNDDLFPGLEATQPDMQPYNKDRHPLDRRTLLFYRTTGGALPLDDPNLHLCAHLYASDRNSLYHPIHHMDVADLYTQMASLVLTVSFHDPVKDLLFGPSESGVKGPVVDASEKGKWFALEDWTSRSGHGRAMNHAWLSGPEGRHVATVTQDGLIRYTKAANATAEEIAALRERKLGWKAKPKI